MSSSRDLTEVSEAGDLTDVSEDAAHNYLQMSSSRDLTADDDYALLSVKFSDLKMCQCNKSDENEVWNDNKSSIVLQ